MLRPTTHKEEKVVPRNECVGGLWYSGVVNHVCCRRTDDRPEMEHEPPDYLKRGPRAVVGLNEHQDCHRNGGRVFW